MEFRKGQRVALGMGSGEEIAALVMRREMYGSFGLVMVTEEGPHYGKYARILPDGTAERNGGTAVARQLRGALVWRDRE